MDKSGAEAADVWLGLLEIKLYLFIGHFYIWFINYIIILSKYIGLKE